MPGTLTVEGVGACSDHDEYFKVYCASGTVMDDYAFIDTNDLSGTRDSGIPCTVQNLIVNGHDGEDRIEVDGVGAARIVDAGAGNDTLLLRNGARDTADCGADTDSIQADQHSVDSAANCEINDFLPEAATATPKKKCKKKHKRSAVAAKKCKKHRAAT